MKKLLSVLVLLLAVVFATAQTPKINYQAVVRDSHNRLVANTTIQVEVTVTYSGGTYNENLSGTTNANGLLSLEIGGGSNFNLIDWSTATIQTMAHLPGNETLQDVVNVTAVPLALHAEYADSVNLNVIANYLNSHDIPSGTGLNVQSDWNQTDTQADDYIKNKPSVKDTVSTYLNEHKYVTNATCDSLDFCALMGKVNTLVEEVNELNYALEDLSNTVAVLYGFIDSLGHVIDSLGGVIDVLSSDILPTTIVPEGAIDGKFTINIDGGQVYFSKGNLQWSGTNGWRFATNQYDYIGNNANNTAPTTSDGNYMDLFCWGATGLNGVNPNTTESYYTANENLSGNNDWGACTITNGTTGYRTLTNTEWQYLFDNHIYGLHTVHGQKGIIILPDRMCSAIGFTSGVTDWTSVSDDNWAAMEAAGAVFLPASGYRAGNGAYGVGISGLYWSSVSSDSDNAHRLYFVENGLPFNNDSSKNKGHAVRLVKDAE